MAAVVIASTNTCGSIPIVSMPYVTVAFKSPLFQPLTPIRLAIPLSILALTSLANGGLAGPLTIVTAQCALIYVAGLDSTLVIVTLNRGISGGILKVVGIVSAV